MSDSKSLGIRRWTRRRVLRTLTGLGIGSSVFRRAVAAQTGDTGRVTAEMIQQAEWISGLRLTEDERASTAAALGSSLTDFEAMRKFPVGYDVPPALTFLPVSDGADSGPRRGSARPLEQAAAERPESTETLALLPISELAALVRTRQVSSVELTRLYLERLHKFDPLLHCVVTFTDELALRQADHADRELAAGRYRGPLHGIPWGAKDLIAYPGYKTTWGATPFRDQVLDTKATVATRLEEAGAVLVAKLSLGALAQGDVWFGGTTRNPWNIEQGASGSSAGSAAATAAGLVGFAIGSETLGSIISPCRRCGVTGLRPTFGAVSRHGCMTLSWSMDKLGPIARSVEDCALVYDAIRGADGLDQAAVDRPFTWPPTADLRSLKVGYFEDQRPTSERSELTVLKELGVRLVPIRLPDEFPVWAMMVILNAESAAVFDGLVRDHVTEGLKHWPAVWREAEFIPAVEYLRANRLRTLLIRRMEEIMSSIDLYVGGDDLAITNLTGHPTVILPNGLVEGEDKGLQRPSSITFTGRMAGETQLLAVAHAYQTATGHHLLRPNVPEPPLP